MEPELKDRLGKALTVDDTVATATACKYAGGGLIVGRVSYMDHTQVRVTTQAGRLIWRDGKDVVKVAA